MPSESQGLNRQSQRVQDSTRTERLNCRSAQCELGDSAEITVEHAAEIAGLADDIEDFPGDTNSS